MVREKKVAAPPKKKNVVARPWWPTVKEAKDRKKRTPEGRREGANNIGKYEKKNFGRLCGTLH